MEEQSLPPGNKPASRYWIVICPEPDVRGGVWARWYREKCVAVGWYPPDYCFEGQTDDPGWTYARNRLREIRPGDKIIPFLMKWRIGPVGTVVEVKAADAQWDPTVAKRRLRPKQRRIGKAHSSDVGAD